MNSTVRTATLLTSEESFHNNYGAILQGYALYNTLIDLNISPIIVRYQGGQFQNTMLRYYIFRVKRVVGSICHKMIPTALEKEARKIKRERRRQIRSREKNFMDFERENMRFFNDKRINWNQLKSKYPQTDAYICGSDQIWNPFFRNQRNDPGYFLAFAPPGSLKIAYAPSFGCDDLPDAAKQTLRDLLKDYNAISVREQSGIDIVKRYAGRDAKHVLDPTMLRTSDQWKSISRIPDGLPEKYILSYRFADSEKTKSMIDRLSQVTGLPVISLPLSLVAIKDEYQSVFEAGPREFIGLIEKASLVCTDSFHATVFSILMDTPVDVFLREGYSKENSMNSRVFSLLNSLGLESLIISPEAEIDVALGALKINYAQAHARIAEKREESLAFLNSALKCEGKKG